ncbi:hypothetical protein ATANTOWER_005229 [Ataeniobius toweri]|uniref:C-type lectin domain-containing protein n=1 Tax=Ataeniobius toweri TaxID=208326 RepID=A0ABU7CEQ7_9TELE|nr:hypothetical protein [Ataeniobius toweri]
MYRPGMSDYVNEQPRHTDRLNGETNLSERRFYLLLFLTIGVLCIIQATLNLSLRLTLYSSKIAVTSICNMTDFGGENPKKEEETDCEQMKPGQCKKFLESIRALNRDRLLLENRNSELLERIKLVEQERDILTMKLTELNGCVSPQLCLPGWREINFRCYFLSTEINTWEDSRKHCQSQGADLVVINSIQEQIAIYHLNGSKPLQFWIGLHARDETFQWVDGSGLEKSFWLSGQPDLDGANRKDDCVKMNNGRPQFSCWNDAPCGHKLHWLCEKDLFTGR